MVKRTYWATATLPETVRLGDQVPVRFLDRDWTGRVQALRGPFAVVAWGAWEREFHVSEGGGDSRYGLWLTEAEVRVADQPALF